MMQRFYSWPIRVHLTILIALLAIPSISLIVYSGIAGRHQAISNAKADCLRFVNDAAGQQQAVVVGAEQLATALSLLPPIQSRNPAATNALLADLVRENPQYVNIYVTDKSGLVWASATPFVGKVSAADRKWFQEAIRTGMFSSGEYAIGRILKKHTIGFGWPVKNTSHELIAVIAIGLDLDYVQHMFERLDLPPGSTFGLLDHRGVILATNFNNPKPLISRTDTRKGLFAMMTKGSDQGNFETIGDDGRYRLYAYRGLRLPHESEPYIYIRSSIPLSSAVSKANAAMFRNLSAFVALFLVGLALAWFIGKRIIVSPIMMLKGASERLAAGADTVNVSHAVKGGELGELAHAFDGMAEALIQEKTALRMSERRWATTLSSIGDAVIATDVEGRITFMNAVAEGLTGWALRGASRKPVTDVFRIVNEYSRKEVESPVAKVLREGMVVGLANHTILVKKDGTEVPIDDSGAPIRDADGNIMGVVLVFRDISNRRQMEEALGLSEEKFAKAFAINPAAVAMTRLEDGRIVEVNETWSAMFGYNRDEVVGSSISLSLWPTLEDRARCAKELQEKGSFRGWEQKLLRRSGEPFTALASAQIMNVAGEEVVLSTWLDINDRKRAEEALRESERHERERAEELATMLEALPTPVIIVHNSEGTHMTGNRAADELFRQPRGTEISLSAPPEVRSGHFRAIKDERELRIDELPARRAARGENVQDFEYSLVFDDGTARDLLAYGTPLWDNKGQPRGAVHTLVDITERKAIERELQKARDDLEQRVIERTEQLANSEKEFRSLAEAMPQIVWITKADGWNIYFNQQWVDYTGLTLEESYGHGWNKPFHPDDQKRAWDAWQNAVTNNGTYSLECRLRKADGTYRWWLVRGVPVANEKGETTKWFGTCTDIEEFKGVEAQLRQAQKLEALGTLSGGIAHDFNNILAAIIGFGELLEGHVTKGSRYERHLKRILEASLRGRDLVRQLLTFSRKVEQEKKPVLLSSIVRETVKLVRATTPATIDIKLGSVTESGLVLGDPTQIQQVLMNLCTNAVHAMMEKGGTLNIELSDFSVSPSNGNPLDIEPGLYMKLTVRDTGIGMPPDIMDRIFDPFFTTKGLGAGTGLGLAVVLGIVKQSNGYIAAESEPGRGSTFTVYFPKITEEVEIVESSDESIPTGDERILFVDDEEALVEMGEDVLAEIGYDVTSRTGSKEALSLVREDPARFDLVITDQTMPAMTGVELAREILAIRPDMPIIMCTGFSHLVDADKAKAAGIRAFAMKPLTKREIARTIRQVLDE